MAKKRSGQGRVSTTALAGWALFMLVLGVGLGALLSQQACERRARKPAERTEPAPKPGPRRSAPPPTETPEAPPRPQTPKAAEPNPPQAQPAQTHEELPRLALVIDDLGYAAPELVTRLCAQTVPFSVAVLPYQMHTRESAEIAFSKGKEVMLHLPMEPLGYPAPGKDPGPFAVMFNLPEAEVRARVKRALDAIPHRRGVNNHMGSRITPDRTRMNWVLQEIKANKCFFVDSRTEKDSVAFDVAEELKIPSVQRKVFLDDNKAFPEMEKQWERALGLAKKDGQTLIIGHIYPETVEALEKLIPRTKGRIRFVKAGDLVK